MKAFILKGPCSHHLNLCQKLSKQWGKAPKTDEASTRLVQASIRGFVRRRKHLLYNTAERDIGSQPVNSRDEDLYSNRAIANLMLGRFVKEANARIRRTAEWFDHPHPQNHPLAGECDFAAMKLCRCFHLFGAGEPLEQPTVTGIRRFFLTKDFKSKYSAENHHLLFRTSRYLMAQALPDKRFQAYEKTGRQLLIEDKQWLDSYIRFRARRGWGEFDSSCYFVPVWECLSNLYDYSHDGGLKDLAGMMMSLLLVDMAVDSLKGMYCGAHGRIYECDALDHATAGTYPLQYLYFGNLDDNALGPRGTLVDALVCSYRPPRIVVDIALNRDVPYENFERKHLHNTMDVMPAQPLDGSIYKYTYYTPHYVMGCVQRQDAYPENCQGKWYAHHEQHQWDLTLGTRTNARLFTHHPGKRGLGGLEHGYWTGDIGCGCGHFFQYKNALLALYDIPQNELYQFIHAYVPKAGFDEVLDRDGFLFVRGGDVCAALKLLGGHDWTTTGPWKDVEVISHGAKNGAVCEVGMLSMSKSFHDFCQEILENNIHFDKKAMCLRYRSHHVGELRINTKGLREVNGELVDLEYPTYHCPYVHSEWDSGIIDIRQDDQHLRLDFRTTEHVRWSRRQTQEQHGPMTGSSKCEQRSAEPYSSCGGAATRISRASHPRCLRLTMSKR